MVVYEALPFLLQGIITTLGLVLSALFLGFIIGVPLAIGQVFASSWIKKLLLFTSGFFEDYQYWYCYFSSIMVYLL